MTVFYPTSHGYQHKVKDFHPKRTASSIYREKAEQQTKNGSYIADHIVGNIAKRGKMAITTSNHRGNRLCFQGETDGNCTKGIK